MRPAKEVFIFLKLKKKKGGWWASHIIVSCYFREQYQFPTQHLFLEEIEMPFLYEQFDQFLWTLWPWIIQYKIRIQRPLVLPEWGGHLSRCLIALPSFPPPHPQCGGHALVVWGTVHSQQGSLGSPGSGQEVLLPSESKLLICFSQQLTFVTGFDSIEEQFVLYSSWHPEDVKKKKSQK